MFDAVLQPGELPAVSLVVLVIAAIALLWGGVFLRFAGLYVGSLAVIVVSACLGYEFYHAKVGPLPLTADRALPGVLCLLYVIRLRLRRSFPGRLGWSDICFGAFLLVLTANTLLHDWRYNESQPLASLLFLYLLPAALYWLLRELTDAPGKSLPFLGMISGFGLYLGLIAIAEVGQFHGMVFPGYIVTSSTAEWLGRARGPFLNPTTNGMFLSTAVFAWALLWTRVEGRTKLAVLAALAFCLVGVGLTLTRSCWLGAMAGLVILALTNMPRALRVPAVALGSIVLAGLLLVGKDGLKSFKRDKDVSEFHMEQSAKLRPILAAVAWRVFQDYPVFGCGYGQYKRVDGAYLRDPDSSLPLETARIYVQHNLFLSLLVDTGLCGLGTYLATLACWGHCGWQLWSDRSRKLPDRQLGLLLLAFLAQWTINGMFHDVGIATNANLLLFALAGTCQGLLRSHSSCQDSPGNVSRMPLGSTRASSASLAAPISTAV